MLFMLTPEIKTNLILKEIGIKRYSLRSSNDQSHKKSLHFYKKGHILALLDKPYENFVREQQDLLIAIFSSTKIDNGEITNYASDTTPRRLSIAFFFYETFIHYLSSSRICLINCCF